MLATFFYVALLLPSIIDGKSIDEYSHLVYEISESDGVINDVFKPFKSGIMGQGGLGFVYKGILGPIKKTIAMKFTIYADEAEQEYKMYSYLGAINNTNVERFGIPTVYYYGPWKGTKLTMMGLSLLEAIPKEFVENDVNTLILIRDFILSSKYMHSCCVRHDDIKLENMLTKYRTFVIDFNISSKMNVRNKHGTLHCLPRRSIHGERYPKDDWESLLYSVATKYGVKFPWAGLQSFGQTCALKLNTTNTMALIKNIESKQLRNILHELAEHIFDDGGEFESNDIDSDEIQEVLEDETEDNTFYYANDEKRFPDYNHWYKVVDDEIQKSSLPKPVMFTWLTPNQRDEAIDYLKNHRTPNISKINDPRDCRSKIYPNVDLETFTRAYKHWKASSPQSFVCTEPTYGSIKSESSTSSLSNDYFTCSDEIHPKNIE